MLRALRILLGTVAEHPGTPPLDVLTARVEALESAETLRSAEHAAMCDRLDRLYKRMVARIARATPDPAEASEGESVLTLRDRVRRARGS